MSGVRAAIGLGAVALIAVAAPGCYLSHQLEVGDDGGAPRDVRFVAIVAGDDHTCAIAEAGALWCWGFGQQGQLALGIGDAASCEVRITEGPVEDRPTRAPVPPSRERAIAAGAMHTCVTDGAGGLACSGGNCRGQLGVGDARGRLELTSVSEVGERGGWSAVWAGGTHACARDGDARLWCWGANEYGQLGLGTTSPRSEPGATMPVRIEGVRAPSDAGLGVAHTCVLDESGRVACWGANGAGQLGDGTRELRSLPATVVGLPDGPARDVSAGDRHSCAIVGESAYCWGWNERGQVGDGAICAPDEGDCVERVAPARVALDGRIDAIDAGAQHTCALRAGEVWCWGANDVGQLGDGTRTSTARPVLARGIDDARAIAIGANHGCALRADGSIACWGRNAQGQLGDGTRRDAARAVRAAPRELAP